MVAYDAGSVVTHLRLDSGQFNAALAGAQQQMQSFAHSLTRMGSYLTLRATLPLVIFGRKAVKSFAQFNDAIIRAAAVTRGMTQEMRKEMERTALQLSKESLFSATELAEGYFALGQAGYSAAQQIKVLPIVEEFATAATLDLDASIRYLARTAEGLGMAMETPEEMMRSMTEVSNAFTFAAITTTAEIHDFAVAMTHAAAPALKLVNKSMKEGISVLMAFARAGIVAEEAGTLLWTTVRDLQRANIRFRNEWERLGLTIYDDFGMMRNLADIFSDLEDKFANMSDETKKASLQMLGFQDRSLRGIQALMGFSDEMKIFQKAMDNMGNLTEKVSDTYKKSFNAQLKMAKHYVDNFVISVGWMLSPMIIKVNELLKRFVNWWESLGRATKLVIVQIGILVAVVGPLLLIFGKLVFLLSYATVGFKTFGTILLGAVIKPVIWAIAVFGSWLAVIGLLVAIAYTLRAAWKQGLTAIVDRFQDWFNEIKRGVDWLANDVFGEFFNWFRDTWEEVLNLTLDDVRNVMTEIAAEVQGAIAFWKQFPKMIKEAWTEGSITGAVNKIKEGMQTAKLEYIKAFADVWATNSKTRKNIDEFVTAVDISFRAFGEATKEHLIELGEALKKQFGEDVAAVTDLIKEKVRMMNKELLDLLPGEDMIEIVVALDKAMKKIKEMEDWSVAIGRWGQYLDQATNAAERFTDVAVSGFEKTTDALVELTTTGKTSFKELAASILTDIQRVLIRMMLVRAFTQFFPGNTGGFAWKSSTGLGGIDWGKLFGGGIKQETLPNYYPPNVSLGTARGAAFHYGNMIRMQTGGIVDQATLFAMGGHKMGLMGEAGPEAVLPLSRSKTGELGVRAEQPNVTVEPKIKINNIFDREEQYAAMQSERGEKIIMNILRRLGVG